MMRSLFSGVAGLKVHQTRMDVIGNNIANINTIGFKSSRTTFSDIFSQLQRNATSPTDNRGGVSPRQIGLGGDVESIDLIFTDSSPQQTGKNTDLALSGNGLFVLRSGEQYYYTRNGSFSFDEEGYYVMPGNGLRVQGWNATDEGVLNTNALATDIIVPVGKTMEATETTAINYQGNLNKETLMIKKIQYTAAADGDATLVRTPDSEDEDTTSINVDGTNVLAATITLSDDTELHVTSGYYEVGKSVPITTLATIYDSLGGKHQVTLLIDKDPSTTDDNLTDAAAEATVRTAYTYTDDDGNTYPATRVEDEEGNVSYTYVDSDGNTQTVTEGVTENEVYDNRWRIYIAPGVGQKGPASDEFTNSYTATEADGSTIVGTMNTINFLYFSDRGSFISNGQTDLGSITFEYSNGNGAASNQATINLTGLTQYANNTTSFPSTNGNTSGVLQSLAIDGNGIITGTYTNGLIRAEAQIAVAQFSNSAGLSKVGTTIYQESNNSGEANIKTIADFGITVVSSALEMSNVDLASEFADMIITQRGFQANSKMTTVADEMLETVVNMKR